MNEDTFLMTGMFDLKSLKGFDRLEPRDLEDIGVTKRDGVYYDQDGKAVRTLEDPSFLSKAAAAVREFLASGSVRQA